MELLALTRLVAPSVWKTLLETNPYVSINESITDSCAMDTYAITLSDTDRTEAIPSLLDAVFSPVDDSERSDEFRQAKAALVAQETRDVVRAACDTLRISIRLDCFKLATNQHKAIMQWHDDCHDRPLRCNLVGVSHCDGRVASIAKAEQVHAQVERGISIDTACLGFYDRNFELSRGLTNQYFTDLLGEYGAKRLDLRHLNEGNATLEAFFSKLTGTDSGTTTLARLSSLALGATRLGGSPMQRRSGLLWWMYGLFSQDARHSIRHLEQLTWMGTVDCVEDLRWVVKMLRSHGAPQPELFISDSLDAFVDRGAPRHEQWLTVPINYPIDVQREHWGLEEETYRDHATTFRVLRNDPSLEFVDILAPGYGRCWVKRSETVKVETRPVVPWTFDQHTISSMNLGLVSLTDAEKSCLVELLGLVGRPVKSLHFTRWKPSNDSVPGDLDLAPLGDIVRSCPQLEELGFTKVGVRPETLVDLYELHSCRANKLEILEAVFLNPTDIVSFLEALGDPKRRISRKVDALSIHLSGLGVVGVTLVRSLVTALFQTLQTNHVLQSVTVYVEDFYHTRLKREFRVYQNAMSGTCVKSVPRKVKRALLSVVDTWGIRERAIATSVLDFAAERAKREVSLCVATPIYLRAAPTHGKYPNWNS